MSKALIVFYSRTGTTRRLAMEIKKKLQCDIEEIKDMKNRKGIIDFIKGGRDAMKEKLTKIAPVEKRPEDYDMIILATPIWASKMCPAIRTYINEYKDRFKSCSFLCTCGSGGIETTIAGMEKLTGKPVASTALTHKDIKAGQYLEKINEFIEKIS